MAIFVNDTFTGANGTALTAHTSEGTTWARHSWNSGASTPEIQGNALQATATNDEEYFYADNAPAAADYEATTRFVISTVSNANLAAACVRLATGAATGYSLYYNSNFGSPILRLYKNIAGTTTALGSNVAASLGVDTYLITLKAVGTALTGRVQRTSDSQWLTSAGAWQAGQVDCMSATDGDITAAGKAGLMIGCRSSASENAIDSFVAADISSGTPVGLATETNTALALAAKQVTATGLATETDTALALPATAGFDFHTAAGLIFGDLAGALTSLAREAAVSMVLRVYAVASPGSLVHESGTLTTGSNGRLPRFTHSSLSLGANYHCMLIRASDGEIVSVKLPAT